MTSRWARRLLVLGVLGPVGSARAADPSPEDGGEELVRSNRRLREAEALLDGLRRRQLDNLDRLEAVAAPEDVGTVRLTAAEVLVERATAADDVAATFLDELAERGEEGTAGGEGLHRNSSTAPRASRRPARKAPGAGVPASPSSIGNAAGGDGSAPECRSYSCAGPDARSAGDRHTRVATEAREQAVARLRAALEELPAGPRRREARQLLAVTLATQGASGAAAREQRRLVRTGPNTPEGRKAALLLAEAALAERRMRKAERLYGVAAGPKKDRPGDETSRRARHKLAWCQARRGEAGRALDALETLLRDLERPGVRSPLRVRVQDDYLYLLAQREHHARAVRRLARAWGASHVRGFLPGLAEAFRRERRHRDALLALQEALRRPASVVEEVTLRWRVVQVLAADRRSRDALAEMRAGWAALGRLRRSPAHRTPEAAAARSLAEEVGRGVLLARHDELLRHKGRRPPVGREVELLEAYLGSFQAAPGRHEVRMALGNLLHGSGRHGAAADQYEAIFGDEAAGPLRAEAGKGAVLALGQVLEAERDPGQRRAAAERMARLTAAYLQEHAGGPLASVARLERAEALRLLDRPTEALAQLEPVAAGRGERAEEAADAILALHLEARDWAALARAAAAFRDRDDLGDPAFEARMEKLRCKAAFRTALAAEEKAAAARSAKRRRRGVPGIRLQGFATDSPGCAEAAPALLEAARRLRDAGRPEGTYAALRTLADQHADSPEARSSAGLLAAVCEDLGDLPCEVEALTSASAGGSCEERVPLVLRAATLERTEGRPEEALVRLQRLARRCPRAEQPETALVEEGLTALVRGDLEAAERHLEAWAALRPGERELAVLLVREARALAAGKAEVWELEGLLAEYAGSPGPVTSEAALAAVVAVVRAAGDRLEAAAPDAAGGDLEALERLATETAVLERWAGTADTSAGDPRLRAEALVRAALGLSSAAEAVAAAGREVEELAADAAALRVQLRERGEALARRAAELEGAATPWRLRARVLLAGDAARRTWEGLAPHLTGRPASWLPFPAAGGGDAD